MRYWKLFRTSLQFLVEIDSSGVFQVKSNPLSMICNSILAQNHYVARNHRPRPSTWSRSMIVETAFRDRESACSPEITDWIGASFSWQKRFPRDKTARFYPETIDYRSVAWEQSRQILIATDSIIVKKTCSSTLSFGGNRHSSQDSIRPKTKKKARIEETTALSPRSRV